MESTNKKRCSWVGKSELLASYHDLEWGKEIKNDHLLFEFLILEGAQAGLNWSSILSRRAGYRNAFLDFDSTLLCDLSEADIDKLLLHPGIIRNRSKINSVRTNARSFIKIKEEYGSFYSYLYRFMPEGKPKINHWKTSVEVPVSTPESVALSKDMKKNGFTFFGPVICYAFMQATGMVNDHLESCSFKGISC